MRWPWVSRARFDNEREARRTQMIEMRQAQERCAAQKEHIAMQDHNLREMRRLYDALAMEKAVLFDHYHALRVSGANAPEPEKVIPPPKRPPAIVYRAMRAISPRDDATFAANWRLWEENQDECDKDPERFAERIKRGRMTPEQPRAD